MPFAMKPGLERLGIYGSRLLSMFALTFGMYASISAQNLFLENRTDCDFEVIVRYADVGCDWSLYPEYTPSNVCNPNPGVTPYSAPAQTNTNYTTPNGSQICSLNIYDVPGDNLLLSCGCGLVYCHLEEYYCVDHNISIDVTVTAAATTIKWY